MSADWIDQPRSVRPGEELDEAALFKYLESRVPGLEAPLTLEQFPGGHSNLTYNLRCGNRELVLRRPPRGAQIKTAHDMGREFRILSHLMTVYPKAPRPLYFCEDPAVLGAPFYIMERVTGVILRRTAPDGLVLAPEMMRRLSEGAIDNLAEIHAIDYGAAGLADLGRPDGYVSRQVHGWSQRYHNAKTDTIPEMEVVMAWLVEHMPKESGSSLIHNDYKYDNLVLDVNDLTTIRAVLDWEMATVGDPLMDLGSTLGYWVDPDDPAELQSLQFGLTSLPGNLGRRQLAERYAAKSGRSLGDVLFYYVYALFKIAVIVQQIYARYRQGFSQDERFTALIYVVHVVSKVAELAIEKKRIDRLSA
ncbi:MAG: phosphotransferase family protein [Acidobacteria bacterium]|nr:phosphotransferase family protein [Acidobacteriota bacterium]MBI3658278.1 phosphotransferase family protein [Acidobacteriota bacterium]